MTLPGSPISIDASSPPPDFGFGLKNGKFDHAGFGVEFGVGARPDLFPPFHSVLLTHVGAAIGLNPLRLTGTIGLSSGEVVDEDGVLFAAFASQSTPYEFPDDVGPELAPLAGRTLDTFSLAVGGTASLHVPVLGVLPLLNSYGLYEYPDYFEFGGGFDFEISFLKIDGGVKGFVLASRKLFNLEGGLNACLRGIEIDFKIVSIKISPCLKVGAVVSSKGIGFCGIVPDTVPDHRRDPRDDRRRATAGAPRRPTWRSSAATTARIARRRPRRRRRARRAAVTLPAGLDAAMLRVRGDGGAPRSRSPIRGGGRSPKAVMTVVMRTGDGSTLVALRKPAAGRWTVTAKRGSPPITGLASANALPKLAIRATVRRRGSRRVLAYRVTGGAGRTVTFAEQGARTARILGVASRRAGTIVFTPAPGRRGKRRIVALVDRAAGPAKPITVTSYTRRRRAAPVAPAACARRAATARSARRGSACAASGVTRCSSPCATARRPSGPFAAPVPRWPTRTRRWAGGSPWTRSPATAPAARSRAWRCLPAAVVDSPARRL